MNGIFEKVGGQEYGERRAGGIKVPTNCPGAPPIERRDKDGAPLWIDEDVQGGVPADNERKAGGYELQRRKKDILLHWQTSNGTTGNGN